MPRRGTGAPEVIAARKSGMPESTLIPATAVMRSPSAPRNRRAALSRVSSCQSTIPRLNADGDCCRSERALKTATCGRCMRLSDSLGGGSTPEVTEKSSIRCRSLRFLLQGKLERHFENGSVFRLEQRRPHFDGAPGHFYISTRAEDVDVLVCSVDTDNPPNASPP